MRKGVHYRRKKLSIRASKIICLSFLFILSCAKHEYSKDELSKLRPSHLISNDSIIKMLQKFDSETVINKRANTFILFSKRNAAHSYTISIAKVNFNTFRRERINMYFFRELKGFCLYKKTPILLYGDVDENIAKQQGSFPDILFQKDNQAGRIIFEPVFTDYYLKINSNQR
jgi:hypothetical protein